MANKHFPFVKQELDPETSKMMSTLFVGEREGFVRIGPKGYLLTQKYYKEMAADIYNMEIRTSDVFVVTYARSGTTWTQELVWLVANNLDYEKSRTILLQERFPFLEHAMMIHSSLKAKILEELKGDEKKKKILELSSEPHAISLASAPSPRFIKTHLPLSLLPTKILDAKVIYVARDPRDVAVSFYTMSKTSRALDYRGDFKQYWNCFVNDLVHYTPFFDHLKEAWENRYHPNMLFLFYEELKKDLSGVVKRVVKFLDKDYSEEQLAKLCDYLEFNNFKSNPAVNGSSFKEANLVPNKHEFVRSGKPGGWRDFFDEEMTVQAQKWIEDNLKDTDLRFPF